MNPLFSTFCPTTFVRLGTRDWEVRELSWPDALELFRRLGAAVTGLLTPEGSPRPVADVIPTLIESGGEAIDFLVQRSAGITAEELRQLPASHVVRLARAALELTVNEEVLNEGNAAAGRLRRAFGLTQNSQPSSTSWSKTVTGTST